VECPQPTKIVVQQSIHEADLNAPADAAQKVSTPVQVQPTQYMQAPVQSTIPVQKSFVASQQFVPP